MNYNSWVFWVLFALVFIPYWRLGHRQQNTLLLFASYAFYGSWDYRFLYLILLSTVIDYIGGLGVAGVQISAEKLRKLALLLVGSSLLLCSGIDYGNLWNSLLHQDQAGIFAALPHQISNFYVPLGTLAATLLYQSLLPSLYAAPEQVRRKRFLVISMVANLAILGFFKYFDFFLTGFHGLLSSLGVSGLAGHSLGVILPAGISFYTFQAMSYTIDIYRNEVEPTESFGDFALFVCFFPHLVAGPIMRAHTLLPQVTHARTLKSTDMEEGFYLVLVGLFKKLIIADNMAPIANAVFMRFIDGNTGSLSGAEVLVGLYAFAFQIYGDFSGYSSIARGISKWLGFDLVINFRMPYLAVSPSDFWQRWHISLSSWLRDYLYIPLGGNRKGVVRTYYNLMLTMILGGLWHGANWTFVAWGVYHGFLLCLFRYLKIPDDISKRNFVGKVQWVFRVLLMFHLTCFGWLLFRADNFQVVIDMSRQLFTNFHPTLIAVSMFFLILFYCTFLFLLEWTLDGEKQIGKLINSPWLMRSVVYACLILILLVFPAEKSSEFIYFQF